MLNRPARSLVGRTFARTEDRDADTTLDTRDAQLDAYNADAGHGFLFQYPEEFAAEVEAFLA